MPTGYGKSLIFQLIPDLVAFKRHKLRNGDVSDVEVRRDAVVIVICPLDSLMANHAESLIQKGIPSAVLRCGKFEFVEAEDNLSDSSDDGHEEYLGEHDRQLLTDCETVKQIRNGASRIVFAHPEAIVTSKQGRSLLQTRAFQSNVVACVVDEAHCIDNW